MRVLKTESLGFKSKVVYEKSAPERSLSNSAKQFIDRFDEGDRRGAILLGKGVTAEAYFVPEFGFVIKQGHENPYIRKKRRGELGSLAYENDILISIDPKVEHSQHGIAYVETENKKEYLLSTFVPGIAADAKTNPLNSTRMDRLLRTMYRLDKSGIIHSDLSGPNVLFDKGDNANIIDYQYGEKVDLSKNCCNYGIITAQFPFFEAPNNATMFEGAALSGYLRDLSSSDAEKLLKEYTMNKAYYNAKKAKRLKGDMSAFEQYKAAAFEHPNEDVLNAEVLKMNIINCQRRQYTGHDPNVITERNILKSIPLMIRAKDSADSLANFQPSYSSNIGYVAYMKNLGKHWSNILNNWYPGTIKWIHNMLAGYERPEHSRIIFSNKLDDFKGLDLVDIGNSYKIEDMHRAEDLRLREIFLNSFKNKYISENAKNEVETILHRIFR